MSMSWKRVSFYFKDKAYSGLLLRNKSRVKSKGWLLVMDSALKKRNALLEWKTVDPKSSLFSC